MISETVGSESSFSSGPIAEDVGRDLSAKPFTVGSRERWLLDELFTDLRLDACPNGVGMEMPNSRGPSSLTRAR